MFSHVEVVTPPEPIVTPADISGSHASDDSTIAALIAAVTGTIAAPNGWLGRSLGVQTLRWSGNFWPDVLPCRPILEVVGVEYTDPNGDAQTLDPSIYRTVSDRIVPTDGGSWPAISSELDAVRITYQAGYEEVPAEARQAVIVAVQHLRDLGAVEVFTRSETVEGIGVTSYAVTPAASETVKRVVGSLLAGLRIYRF